MERILSISGEDPQDVHRKNLPTLTGSKLPVKFILMTNELPNMRDASGALTTRVIMLRMTRSLLGNEDRTLGQRLSNELPGILNWAIHGWTLLRERGHFEQPRSGQELMDDLRDIASPIGMFVQDRCWTGPEFQESMKNLFTQWRNGCDEHGRDHPGTEQSFGKDLRAAIPSISVVQKRLPDGTRPRLYNGIGLRN